jgi:hypothetical protein
MKDGGVFSDTGKPIMNIYERKLFRFPDRIECRPAAGAMSRVARFVPIAGTTIRTRFDQMCSSPCLKAFTAFAGKNH